MGRRGGGDPNPAGPMIWEDNMPRGKSNLIFAFRSSGAWGAKPRGALGESRHQSPLGRAQSSYTESSAASSVQQSLCHPSWVTERASPLGRHKHWLGGKGNPPMEVHAKRGQQSPTSAPVVSSGPMRTWAWDGSVPGPTGTLPQTTSPTHRRNLPSASPSALQAPSGQLHLGSKACPLPTHASQAPSGQLHRVWQALPLCQGK